MSLEHTIVNLAQNFVGSNNLNLLVPSGQFGTRLQGGKDHAAARYIYTRLANVTRLIFHPDDDHILEYLDDEGQRIEPKWYCPIIPMVLVNGAEGIGVGWSTSVPNYSPREIVRNIRRLLRSLPLEDMVPWYRGFRGSIAPSEQDPSKLEVTGLVEKKSDTALEVTELPVKVWTLNYKEFLEELMPQDKRKSDDDARHTIEEFREYHTENSVHFELKLSRDKMAKVERQGLEKVLKLRSSMSITNMMLFNHEGKITRYNSALEILAEFCILRRAMYVKRKSYLVGKLTREKEILSNKARFILMVVRGELELRRRKKADLLQELRRLGFKPMSELNALMKSSLAEDPAQNLQAESSEQSSGGSEKTDYDYLLGMALWSLTFEKVEEIRKQLEDKTAELETLISTSVETMWDRDLTALSAALDQLDAEEAEDALSTAASGSGGKGRRKRTVAAASEPGMAAGKRPPPTSREDAALDGVLLTDCEVAIQELLASIRRERTENSMSGAVATARQGLAQSSSRGGEGPGPPQRAEAVSGGHRGTFTRDIFLEEDDVMFVNTVSSVVDLEQASQSNPDRPSREQGGMQTVEEMTLQPPEVRGNLQSDAPIFRAAEPRQVLEPLPSCEWLDPRPAGVPRERPERHASSSRACGGVVENGRESRPQLHQATLFDSFPVHGYERDLPPSRKRGPELESSSSVGVGSSAMARIPFSGFPVSYQEGASTLSERVLSEQSADLGTMAAQRASHSSLEVETGGADSIAICDSPVAICGDDLSSPPTWKRRRRRFVPDDDDEVELVGG